MVKRSRYWETRHKALFILDTDFNEFEDIKRGRAAGNVFSDMLKVYKRQMKMEDFR